LNVAGAQQQQLITGQIETPTKGGIQTLIAAVILLAEAVLAINSSNSATVTLPSSLFTGKYSATYPASNPVQT
jgi:hypothetical protein